MLSNEQGAFTGASEITQSGRDGQPLQGELLLRHLMGRDHALPPIPQTWGTSFQQLTVKHKLFAGDPSADD